MRHYKETPLLILNTIEEFLKKDFDLYKNVDPGNFLVRIEDLDEIFFFNIKNYEIHNGIKYRISFKPRNINVTDEHEVLVEETELKTYFQKWADIIKGYEKIEIFRDPIIEKFQSDFYQKYKIIEPNADIEPFELEKQLLLDQYLEESLSKISKMKEGKVDFELLEFNELENEIIAIRENLTKEPKNKVVNRLSRFWAKAQKIGLPVIKELFIKLSVELAKLLLLGPNSNPE